MLDIIIIIRSIAKLKLLKSLRTLSLFRACFVFRKVEPLSTEFFVHILSNCSQVLFLSIPCEMVYGEGFSAF